MRALITDDGSSRPTNRYDASRVTRVGTATTIRGWGDLDGPAHYVDDELTVLPITVPDADLVEAGLLTRGS